MKTRLLFNTAALLGAAAILWMGLDFIGANLLALAVTAVIGFVYILGQLELVQYRAATAGLNTALDAVGDGGGDDLERWLTQVPATLHNSVSQRVQGDRVGLPVPVFSPYLVGLLVMLGLLGTFIGMVDTLQGAVTALEGSTELAAIRAGLAAPIQGLSLAFGTSVAGVAASAMLGLNATLSRRERIQVTRRLDGCTATVFREHSLQYNRQQTYLAMQGQAEALPRVAEQLTAMAGELERMGNTLAAQLLENQEKFHAEARRQYQALGESVGASLRESLAASGRLAGESIAPAVEQVMATLAAESLKTNEQLLAGNRAHLEAVSGRLDAVSDRLAQGTGAMAEALREELGALREEEQQRSARVSGQLAQIASSAAGQFAELQTAATEQLASLESAAARHLSTLGSELEQPMLRLIESAEKTPRVVAEVIDRLREQATDSLERDNQLLEDRRALEQELAGLSQSLQDAAGSQQAAIAELVDSSNVMLQAVTEEFRQQLSGEASRLVDITTDVAGSAIELSSLGEAFSLAVQLFSESNQSLVDNLSRIEASMEKSTERSDEQMGYYVAQAREIIDQSMLSQREIIEELRRMGQTGDLFAAEAS